MISRVADHCFWFGRYLDRAESTARLLDATRTMVLDAGIPVTHCWQPLVIVSGEFPQFQRRHGTDGAEDGEKVQRYMVWDEDNLVSLRRSVAAARENARVVRDALSEELWQEVNSLYHWLQGGSAQQRYERDREGFYRQLRQGTQLCLGLVRSTMLHDEPMSFLWLGVMLERAGQLARTLDMHHHTMEEERALGDVAPAGAGEAIVEDALWLALLRACSGFDAFRKLHQGRVTVAEMVGFLVYEERFPRSLMYCLNAARRILEGIWAGTRDAPAPAATAARVLDDLVSWLVEARGMLASPGGALTIHTLLTRVVDDSARASQEISRAMHAGREQGPGPGGPPAAGTPEPAQA